MPDINSKTECLIFSTSLKDKNDVDRISGLLNHLPGIQEWSIDLEDWEKVLRIECINIPPEKIIELLQLEGIGAEEMPIFE